MHLDRAYLQREFHNLLQLQILSLESRNIESIDPNTFKYLQNLREIHLEHNQISQIDSFTFSNLPSKGVFSTTRTQY
jgi:Leucine-rich repeat (LRR) protein